MFNFSKGKTNWKFLFIITVIAVFAGGIMIGAFKLMGCLYWWPSSQQIQSVKNETADWQTYRNEEIGIEFKYPDNYKISISGGHSSSTHPELGKRISLMPKNKVPDINNSYIDINLVDHSYFTGLDNYISKTYKDKIILVDELTTKDIEADIYKLKDYDFFLMFFGKDNGSIIFNTSSESKDFLIKVFSTFRFIEEPYIKINFPNGGEKIKFMDPFEITWESSGVDKIKNIILIDESNEWECQKVELDIPASAGMYDFSAKTVVCDPGDKFKIKIISSDGKISDESDSYFSMVNAFETGISDSYIKNLSGFGYDVEDISEIKQIKDINNDGYSEFVVTASGAGGTCVGGTSYKILYSPGKQEYFIATKSMLGSLPPGYEKTAFCPVVGPYFWEGCGNTLKFTCFSNNLKEEKNKPIKIYLESILEKNN